MRARRVALAAVATTAAAAAIAGCSSYNYSCSGNECSVSVKGSSSVELEQIGATVSVDEADDGAATIEVSGPQGEGSADVSVGETGEAAGYDVLLESVEGDDVDFRIRPAS
jgi:carbon monoxide dehydrogenase subunit G